MAWKQERRPQIQTSARVNVRGPFCDFKGEKVEPGEAGMKLSRDRDLAERAAAGEEEAWRQIYDRTRDRLFALVCYQLGNREDALDVLQETYLHAIQSIRRFRGEGSLEAWLAVIAIRRSTDWRRRFLSKLRQMVPLDQARAVSAHDPPEVRFVRESSRLRESLARLSNRQRTALLLRELAELSFSEVARALGCDEATARVHHLRARKKLQLLLKAESFTTSALCAEE